MEELLTQPRDEALNGEKIESQEELSPINAKIHKLADEIIHSQEILKAGGLTNPDLNESLQNIIEFKIEIVETLRKIAKLDPEKDILEINSNKMYIAKTEEDIRLEEAKISSK